MSVWGMGDHSKDGGHLGRSDDGDHTSALWKKAQAPEETTETSRIETPSGVVGARDHLNSRGS